MRHQKGNALFFILIAIGLLGLLTVMMSRSSNTSNETGSYEQNVIAANEILSYAKNMENAVQGLLARGCSENDISFWHDSDGNGTEDASDDYFNTETSLTDHSCHVFEPEGAGMTWETPNEKWLDRTQSANTMYKKSSITSKTCIVNNTNTPCVILNNSHADILFITPWLNLETCKSLNRILNVISPTGDPPQDDAFSSLFYPFKGIYETVSKIEDSDDDSILFGKDSACFEADSISGEGAYEGTYHFYHVLHAR